MGAVKDFYKSTTWKKCRDNYWAKKKGLCERCLAKGIVKQGEEVHHKVRLNPSNVNDPRVSTNEDNLELLCKECHHQEHRSDRTEMFSKKRYRVNQITGEIAPLETVK